MKAKLADGLGAMAMVKACQDGGPLNNCRADPAARQPRTDFL
ncbi:hypothetical protein [Rhizobium lentis]|uniref:Uncharacterized protein n=1 Tax=Rhizobium lentis TaxID=1138194 RepID=A0A7W8UPS6_9HYPH|nr:hypothetical protein [Rhizobium lentis]MBB4575295.1 hypothetical protein [Rhizobium lentis]MBB5551605.1 hypothetical protein [Rhizobium lentis]MBB5561899.1 hypothetical protein [Rhizobium lentis]MBB5568483.1 hypothetical protein [Rhizobium lentis]